MQSKLMLQKGGGASGLAKGYSTDRINSGQLQTRGGSTMGMADMGSI